MKIVKANVPSTTALKRACGYVLQVKHPLKTLVKIGDLFSSREVEVIFLQMHCYNSRDSTGIIILHCRLEKDRIKFIAVLLTKIAGVERVEWMADTKRDKLY